MNVATPVWRVISGQRTIKQYFFLEMAPLLPRVADVRDLDNGGGAGRGHHPNGAGDCVLRRP